MNKLSINLPEIIFTDNATKTIFKKIEKKKCFLFTSKYWQNNNLLRTLKKKINIVRAVENIEPNPEIKKVQEIFINLKKADYILTIGGGSVIDYTKAVAAFNAIDRKQKYFKTILSKGKKFTKLTIPKIIAIPTTSGTGSEINSWGTVWDSGNKYSVSGDELMPSCAIYDANLCKDKPTALTVSTGLDSLSHAFESILNINHNPLIDEFAKIAIEKIIKFLPLVIKNPQNIEYRKEMQKAAFFSGLAMSKTKTSICHSISYPLTSIFGLPHGIASSLTLSEVSKLNLKNNKGRTSIISKAMGCSNKNLESSLISFFKKLNYDKYLDPIKNIKINKKINFINPARSKNSLVKVSNAEASKIVKNCIKNYIK
ncbi:MAG: iron-containing alcohol dehydrogenase [Pseudomonadota bacterium]|nr:iron-containing alcohol dehydrogenase [Pseudomonadota bacterium]